MLHLITNTEPVDNKFFLRDGAVYFSGLYENGLLIGSNERNGMIEYIKLFWEDAVEGEPPVILYEVDTENERLALRSIDVFADGHTCNISNLYDGAIEITPIPTVEELNAHVWGEDFHACLMEKTEFEAVWESRTYDGNLKESGEI